MGLCLTLSMAKAAKSKKKKGKYDITVKAPEGMTPDQLLKLALNTPVKKKKYVDPSTLLFSVEHKDVIEKTKDGSNVATIDLNAR